MDQLLGLLLVSDNKSVKVLVGSNLELGVVNISLDGDELGVLLAGLLEKLLDVGDLNLDHNYNMVSIHILETKRYYSTSLAKAVAVQKGTEFQQGLDQRYISQV